MIESNTTSMKQYNNTILETARKFDGTEKNGESSKDISNVLDIKIFKRRWLELILFVLYSASNNVQTNQYTIISNVMQRYYGVSSFAIEWTATILPVAYIVLIIPISQLIDRFGLRWTVSIGATLTCLSSWVKFFGSSPDQFTIAFIGHTMVATSQVVIFIVPGRLAACWFGPKQVASATAIACSGVQIGASVCFTLTAIVIKNHEKIEDIGKDLYNYSFVQAIVCTVISVMLIFLFRDEPYLPPSKTRALQKMNQEVNTNVFWPPIKRILSNRSFILLWNSYGMNLSVLNSMITFLNPMYLAHFQNGEVEVGRLALIGTMFGVIGATCFAYILDQTKKFRAVILTLCFIALFGAISFGVSLIVEIKWMVGITSVILGASLTGYSTVGLEMCVEMTYPESEAIATGILSLSMQIYGALLILIVGRLLDAYGDKAGSAYLCGSLTIGAFLTVINKGELQRHKALQSLKEYKSVPLQEIQPMKTELRKVESGLKL